MSIVAEFAASLHEEFPAKSETPIPALYRGRLEKIRDVQVVIFDVYGTLINYWDDSFSDADKKKESLLSAFLKTADRFGFTKTLAIIDSEKPVQETLYDFYHGLIVMKHEQSIGEGKSFPEVKIEEVWDIILSILIRNGYELAVNQVGETRSEFARVIAYFYNFHSLKRGFFTHVVPALKALKAQNIKLGILSNAQFYTPIDLTLFLRDQDEELVDFLELFESDLLFFSYENGVAKPNRMLYEKLFDALYELNVLPSEALFVGNDLAADIKAASEIGMKTALFAGNRGSTFMHDLENKVFPDIVFTSYEELNSKVTFYSDLNA